MLVSNQAISFGGSPILGTRLDIWWPQGSNLDQQGNTQKVCPCLFFSGQTSLFQKYVTLPADSAETKDWASKYKLGCLPECIDSQDATHVAMMRCYSRLKNYYNTSYKLKCPLRTYNLTATHRCQIISTTKGHPGQWNDQILQLYDDLSNMVKEGTSYSNLTFSFFVVTHQIQTLLSQFPMKAHESSSIMGICHGQQWPRLRKFQ